MGKKKHARATDAAESSSSKEMDELKTLNREIAKGVTKSRQRMELLRLEMASLAPTEQDFLASGTIEKLKLLNNQLLQEVAEDRMHINFLNSQLASLAADQEILALIEQEVFIIVIFYGFHEAAISWAADVGAAMKAALSL